MADLYIQDRTKMLLFKLGGTTMTLKELRKEYKLSQIEVASILNIPERTYRRYELDNNYGSEIKRSMFINTLNEHCQITEEKGLLTVEQIKTKVSQLFNNEYQNQIDFCYLFGSYAKGVANEKSDVDLYVSSSLSGFAFVGLIERLRETLHKKVDLIRTSELENNMQLVNEIMKGGIKIYG